MKFSARVKRFPGKGGWHYVDVPEEFNSKAKKKTAFGYVPITASVNNTEWKSFLLPKGDKSYFIALKAELRKKKKIAQGDMVTVNFSFR